MAEENNKENYMGWVTLSMFVYITVISFEDPFTLTKNTVCLSWYYGSSCCFFINCLTH